MSKSHPWVDHSHKAPELKQMMITVCETNMKRTSCRVSVLPCYSGDSTLSSGRAAGSIIIVKVIHDHQAPKTKIRKTQTPGGERKDAANIVARALMSWVDHTFALLRCQWDDNYDGCHHHNEIIPGWRHQPCCSFPEPHRCNWKETLVERSPRRFLWWADHHDHTDNYQRCCSNLIYKFHKPIFCRTLGLSPPQASRASLRLAAAALAVGTRQQEAIRRSRMVKVEKEEERSTMVVPSLDYFWDWRGHCKVNGKKGFFLGCWQERSHKGGGSFTVIRNLWPPLV